MNNEKEDIQIEIPQIEYGELETIVDVGVRNKVSFFHYLKQSFKDLGVKNIFHDKYELIVISMIGLFIMVVSMSNLRHAEMAAIYKVTFTIAPILYLCVVLFSLYNSKEHGVFEIEMTCKYNLYQLAALRMFSFSIISMVVNTASIMIVGTLFKGIDIVRMIMISVTGLFLFSMVFLFSLIKFKGKIVRVLVIVAWFAANLILGSVESEVYLKFLWEAPLYIHFMVTILCAILYVHNLNQLIHYRRKKGEI